MNFRPALPIIFMMPPIAVGAFVMYSSKIPSSIWGQNLAMFLISGILSCTILFRKKLPKPNSYIIISVCIVLLVLTFVDSGLSGVHRWISIGPVKMNVGSIVLPILIIELGKTINFQNWWPITFLIIGVSLILLFQPDASNTSAFAFASIFILFKSITKTIQYLALGIPLIISILAWVYLDSLEPVSYVEEILQMAMNVSPITFALGVLSLLLMPLPFFIFKTKKYKPIFVSIGIYFSLIILSTLFGNFPVPLLGYGISPIIGYAIAITWLFRHNDPRLSSITGTITESK